jgi:glycosyltransferase involved in cell wall biosynthesis
MQESIKFMRILIYTPNIDIAANRGEPVHIRELAENLSKLRHQVSIICKSGHNGYSGLALIKRVRSPNHSTIGFLCSAVYGLFLGFAAIEPGSYDVIYTRAGFAASALILSRLKTVPFVIEVNGLIREEAEVSSAGWLRKASGYALGFSESKTYRHGLHLVAVTPQIKEALIAEYGVEPRKITVIPNGANIELLKPMDTNQTKAQLNLHGIDYLVTFLGGLVAWQGVQYLIESAPYVLKEYPKTKFLIIGDGPMKQELIELAKKIGMSDEIIFISNVPHQKVPLYLNASDVCVAPFVKARNNKCGLSPLKIYEYMACGRPIVSSRITNLELIEQSNAGILVEPENPEALGSTIKKLLGDKNLRHQMGKNGRKYVVENHSWESIAKKVAETCEMALAQKQSSL